MFHSNKLVEVWPVNTDALTLGEQAACNLTYHDGDDNLNLKAFLTALRVEPALLPIARNVLAPYLRSSCEMADTSRDRELARTF